MNLNNEPQLSLNQLLLDELITSLNHLIGLYNIEQVKIGIICLNTVNQLVMTSTQTQPTPLSQPSSSLRGKQICMSDLDKHKRKSTNASKDKYQYQ